MFKETDMITIRIGNKEDWNIVLSILKNAGYKWCNRCSDSNYFKGFDLYGSITCIGLDNNKIIQLANVVSIHFNYKTMSVKEFIELIT